MTAVVRASVSKPIEILPMQATDIAHAAALSSAVGWPHRVEDWTFVYSCGQGLIAHIDGQMVGSSMWWLYSDMQARLGMVIVDPAYQKFGIGRALMDATIDRIPASSIVLNATAAGEPLYRTLGFSGVGKIIQHQGASFSVPVLPLRTGERIRPLGRNDADTIIALDAAAMGTSRASVINALIAEAEAIVLDYGGSIAGFAFYRRFGRGHVIGPVVADSAESAKALITHWIGKNAGMFIRIDITESSGLSSWLDGLGLARASHVITMVRGEPLPPQGAVCSYAVANQALG